MRIIRYLFLIIIGVVLTISLYFSIVLITTKLINFHHRGPETYLGLYFLIIAPVCFFVGSFLLAKFFVHKLLYIKQVKIKNLLPLMPGLYISIAAIIFSLESTVNFQIGMIPIYLVWITSSLLGLMLGNK